MSKIIKLNSCSAMTLGATKTGAVFLEVKTGADFMASQYLASLVLNKAQAIELAAALVDFATQNDEVTA